MATNGGAHSLEVAKPDCVADDFDGEIVVLNLATGVYFSVRDLAASVWRDLAAGHPVESIAAGIGSVDATVGEAAGALIQDFERMGLMRPGEARTIHTAPESIAAVRAGVVKLTMESFEDMKDLILADPIHDADDQFGWPTLQGPGKA